MSREFTANVIVGLTLARMGVDERSGNHHGMGLSEVIPSYPSSIAKTQVVIAFNEAMSEIVLEPFEQLDTGQMHENSTFGDLYRHAISAMPKQAYQCSNGHIYARSGSCPLDGQPLAPI